MQAPGVYAISLSPYPTGEKGMAVPPMDLAAITAWIGRVPDMRLDDAVPVAAAVAAYLATLWHRDESIVYIGKSNNLNKRLKEYFSHTLGMSSPHKGGHWLKTLLNIDDLWIHYAACQSEPHAAGMELVALGAFRDAVLSYRRDLKATPVLAIPFANRTHGGHKQKRLGPEHL